jgi:hypothetical protein
MKNLAISNLHPNLGMAKNYYKSDYERFESAVHAGSCEVEDCERCHFLCDLGLIISCDGCSKVHHTDWLGWSSETEKEGRVSVFCAECKENNQ